MKNILVFPCGSEIGLEIHRSLQYSTHFKLFGASSVDDHGKYVFENYVGGLPFHNDIAFIEKMALLVQALQIDAIYPAMDAVARTLKLREKELGCVVVGCSIETTDVCASKQKTYTAVQDIFPLPTIYSSLESANFPIFIKPDVGYGSRNTLLASSSQMAEAFLSQQKEKFLLCELLTGEEYTVDCFTDKNSQLRFCGPRIRSRVSNGISVNTYPFEQDKSEFEGFAKVLNERFVFRGAWFFQMKRDSKGKLKLLEIAARLGGSSGIYRNKGVNFAMLTLFDAFEYDVEILENQYLIELDRSLISRCTLDVRYECVYVDYDDCLIVNNQVNVEMVGFIYKQINIGKKVHLITRHAGDLKKSLSKYRLDGLFDEISHIDKKSSKADHMKIFPAIFVDDSYTERADVFKAHKMPVFSPDMVEALMGLK